MSQTTLHLTAYQAVNGSVHTARTAKYENGRVTVVVNRSETARPKIYTVTLAPGAREGSWVTDDDSGTIEHVVQSRESGGAVTITGMWSENGVISQMRLVASAELSRSIP